MMWGITFPPIIMTMPSNDRLRYLLTQYTNKNCSREELEELFRELRAPAGREALSQLISGQYSELPSEKEGGDIDWDFMYQTVTAKERPSVRSRIVFFSKIAAAVLVLVAAGFWLWRAPAQREKTPATATAMPAGDALPGTNKAVLVLADGTSVNLDSAGSGSVGQQGNTKIIKLPGQLTYNAGTGGNEAPVFNKVATPRGGQYQLTLSDGTRVWLNSASSIRFPVAFTGSERYVEVTGEAYFEVARADKNGQRIPFRCKVNDMEIAVLGTHFNVNAYADEAEIRTTLLEGSVQVKQGAATQLLAPGQQSRVGKDGQITLARQVNLDEVMGWKNGFFVFEEADIRQIMRQVEKWYNLDVVYEGPVPDGRFNGRVSRNTPASQMMKVLELSGIQFRIEGTRLIIRS